MKKTSFPALAVALLAACGCSGDLRRTSPCFAWAEAVCSAADRCDMYISGSNLDDCMEGKSDECIEAYNEDALDDVKDCVESLEASDCTLETASLLKGELCQSVALSPFEVYTSAGTPAPTLPTDQSTPEGTPYSPSPTSPPSSELPSGSSEDDVEFLIEGGWLSGELTPTHVDAPFYAYDDDYSSLAVTNGTACVSGTVMAVGDGSSTERWGGGIGVDLGWTDDETPAVDLSHYTGIEFETSGQASGLRFGLMLPGTIVYCDSLLALGVTAVNFSELERECWSNSGETLSQLDLTAVVGFRWEFVPKQSESEAVAACIDAVRLTQ
jgi:hypothetical protein